MQILLTFSERSYFERWLKCGHLYVFLRLALDVSLNFARGRLWRVVVIDYDGVTNLLNVLMNYLLKRDFFECPRGQNLQTWRAVFNGLSEISKWLGVSI